MRPTLKNIRKHVVWLLGGRFGGFRGGRNWFALAVGGLAAAAFGTTGITAQEAGGVIHYQGRVAVDGYAFDGEGHFKFALVNAAGSEIHWLNSADSDSNGEPDAGITVSVNRGLYGVPLGDAGIANMAPIPLSVFTGNLSSEGGTLFLRVWFSDGVNGWEQLAPDQPIVPVAFAIAATHANEAATVADGSVTAEKLAEGSVTGAKLVAGSVTTDKLAAGAVTTGALETEAVTAEKLATGAVTAEKISGELLPTQIPGLDAGKITSGVLEVERLPGNVALKDPDLSNLQTGVAADLAALQAEVDSLRAALELLEGGAAGAVQSSSDPADATLVDAGYARFASFPAGGWTAITEPSGLSARVGHGAVWVEDAGQMLVWGGEVAGGIYSGVGSLYRTATGDWQQVPAYAGLSARRGHSMISDGEGGVVIWGGYSGTGYLESGARFDVAEFSWDPVVSQNAPEGRDGHVAVKAGPWMVVLGGRNFGGKLGDGSLYHFSSNTWTGLVLPNAPEARSGAAAVWTGDRVIVWGGDAASGPVNTGGELAFTEVPYPTPNEWTATGLAGAPAARLGHSAVWTGTRMIVWGGRAGENFFSDGASYDPVTDSWTTLPSNGAPVGRADHAVVWTGEEMVIFGGETAAGVTSTGAAYHPGLNRWRELGIGGDVPVARAGVSAVWTGSEMIIFGGRAGGSLVADPQRLNPQPGWHLYRKQ